jgi:hypothetical protein
MKKKPRMTYRVWGELWSSVRLQYAMYYDLEDSQVSAKQWADNDRATQFLLQIAKPHWIEKHRAS